MNPRSNALEVPLITPTNAMSMNDSHFENSPQTPPVLTVVSGGEEFGRPVSDQEAAAALSQQEPVGNVITTQGQPPELPILTEAVLDIPVTTEDLKHLSLAELDKKRIETFVALNKELVIQRALDIKDKDYISRYMQSTRSQQALNANLFAYMDRIVAIQSKEKELLEGLHPHVESSTEAQAGEPQARFSESQMVDIETTLEDEAEAVFDEATFLAEIETLNPRELQSKRLKIETRLMAIEDDIKTASEAGREALRRAEVQHLNYLDCIDAQIIIAEEKELIALKKQAYEDTERAAAALKETIAMLVAEQQRRTDYRLSNMSRAALETLLEEERRKGNKRDIHLIEKIMKEIAKTEHLENRIIPASGAIDFY